MATLFGILLAVLAYGSVIEPRLIMDVEDQPVAVTGLPDVWEGGVIAAMGDFQLGMWGDNAGMVRRIIRKATAENPAAVLLLGDYVYKAEHDIDSQIAEIQRVLQPLADSGIPTFAVLGNHDWGLEYNDSEPAPAVAETLTRALQDLGFQVLQNEAIRLSPPSGEGPPLYIVGLQSHYLGEGGVQAALDQVPSGSPRVVVMHNPDSFLEIPPGEAPFAVAGHTHGGQIAIPFTPGWSWLSLIRDEEVHAAGWSPEDFGEAGNRLYVNRGVGFSYVPIRIHAAPELTLFRLHAE